MMCSGTGFGMEYEAYLSGVRGGWNEEAGFEDLDSRFGQ